MSSEDDAILIFPGDELSEASCARGTLSTRSGETFELCIARPNDMPALKAFLSSLSPDDLRFRFLSPIHAVSNALVDQLLGQDHDRVEHFLALPVGTSEIAASAIIAFDDARRSAEIAICTAPKYKHKGLSWALLTYATDWAVNRGACEVVAVEAADHADAIRLEREQGFTVDPGQSCPGVTRLRKRVTTISA